MTETICKYLQGACYICQKCLYCFKPLQKDPYICKKNIKPLKISNLKSGQQIYHRAFTPNKLLLSADLFLFAANNKFSYNSNFKELFTYTFCDACNSKFQRLRSKVRKLQIDNNNNDESDNFDTSLEKLDVENNLSSEENTVEEDSFEEENSIEEEDSNEEEDTSDDDSINDDVEEDNIEEIKVQIIVKNRNIKMPTAKSLTI